MFNCTVTTDLQSKHKNGFSGIVKHVSHDPEINHSNKDINFNESQFNKYNNDVSKLEKWNEEKFSDYVVNHDIKQRKRGHAERQYGSVKSFLSSKKKATLVLTMVGSRVFKRRLMTTMKQNFLNKPRRVMLFNSNRMMGLIYSECVGKCRDTIAQAARVKLA